MPSTHAAGHVNPIQGGYRAALEATTRVPTAPHVRYGTRFGQMCLLRRSCASWDCGLLSKVAVDRAGGRLFEEPA